MIHLFYSFGLSPDGFVRKYLVNLIKTKDTPLRIFFIHPYFKTVDKSTFAMNLNLNFTKSENN